MYATVNGNQVFYLEKGPSTGETIVLIHGFPFSHEMWAPQIESLAEKLRVLVYDLRGHGRSGVGDGQYAFEFFVDDLVGLLDHLKIQKAVLCGLSMGGYIALRTVERNPERVMGLVLADTQAKADSNEAKLRRAAAIKSIKRDGVDAYAKAFVKSVFSAESLSSENEVVEKIEGIIRSNSASGISGSLLALASRTETTESLSAIKVPTLILVGENDTLTPPIASKEMHSRIPGSELHIIPKAAHVSNLENSREFNRLVLDFLERLR